VTRPTLGSMLLALVVILLCGASPQPAYLDGTQLLPAFQMTFTLHQEREIKPPDPNKKNEVVYFTDGSTLYMKSVFRESPLLPGEPFSFKDQEVEWYVVRDPEHKNQYTARVYCRTCNPKSWALVAVNLGPPRQDLVARFNAKLDIPPLPVPRPSSHLPVLPPSSTPMEWFLTSGTDNKAGQTCLAPGKDQGYFAMYKEKGVTREHVFYKQPYSMVGGGAGAWHQAYGQVIYNDYEIPANLSPAMFEPPYGYKRIRTPVNPIGPILVKSNCSACHITESGPTTFYGEPPPEVPKH
jgi:hypothetical protein